MGAHVFALAISTHRFPIKMDAMHSCYNPPCCNPSHLSWGTRRQNQIDKFKRGRGANVKGERCGRSKLTQTQVDCIRSVYTGKHGQVTNLAKEFNVNRRSIEAIVKGRTWR